MRDFIDLKLRWRASDVTDDGTSDFIYTYEWNENDQQTRLTANEDADPELEYDYTMVYGESGEPLSYTLITSQIMVGAYAYDEHVREVGFTEDSNNDGVPSETTVTTYPTPGTVERRMDYDGDGAFEYEAVLTQTCL